MQELEQKRLELARKLAANAIEEFMLIKQLAYVECQIAKQLRLDSLVNFCQTGKFL